MPAIPALLQLSRASTRLRTPALCLYCRLQSRPVPNLPAFRRYSTSKNVESEKTESASSGNLFDYLTNDYAGSAEDILGEYPTREESEADGPPQVDFGSGTAEAIQDALSTPVDLSEFQTVKRGRPPKMSDIAGGDERFLRRGGTLPIKVDIKMLETMQKRNAYLPTKRKVLRDNAAIAEVAEKILTFTDTGPEDIKNVVEEIETLKPEESVIPEAKFMELKKQIGKRLAKRHLQAYLAWSASNNKDVEIKSKKLKELATYGKKEQLSEAIMEHIWKIFIKERVERIVSEKIKVSKILVYFLLLDDGKILRNFASNAKAQVKVNATSNEVEIKAPIIGIVSIKHWLSFVTNHIVTKELDMNWVPNPEVFTEKFIQEVAQASNTYIKRNDKKFTISALGAKTGNLEGAIRMLINSLDLPTGIPESYMFLIDSSSRSLEPKGNLYCVANKDGLGWKVRNEEWGRWRTTLQSVSSLSVGRVRVVMEDSGQEITRDENVSRVLEHLNTNPIPTLPDGILGLQTEYTAKFGYLLHKKEFESKAPVELSNFLTRLPAINRAPPFHTFIPRLDNLIFPLKPVPDSHLTRIILRFQPDPWSIKDSTLYPPLELRLLVDENTSTPTFESFNALVDSATVDLMSPTERSDLRFERRSWVTFEPDTNLDNAIQDYLSRSTLDMTKQRLVGANSIDVDIPHYLRRELGKRMYLTSEKVRYLFATMDLRYEQSYVFRNRQVRRTVVEGGAIGGRRVEVLVTGRPGEAEEEFVADSLEMLERLT